MSSLTRALGSVPSSAARATRAFSTTQAALKGNSINDRLEKAGLHAPPKHPKSSYAFYVVDHFKQNGDRLKGSDGKVSLSSVAGEISSAWKNISDADKAKYEKLAAEDRARAKKEFDAFVGTLAPGELKKIEDVLKKKVRFPDGRKASLSNSGAPKKPLTAFFLYMNKLRADGENFGLSGPTAQKGFASEAGKRWKALSDSEKQTYVSEAAKLSDAYNASKQ